MLTLHDYLTLCANATPAAPEQSQEWRISSEMWLLYYVGQRTEAEPLCIGNGGKPSYFQVRLRLLKKYGHAFLHDNQIARRVKAANAVLQPLIEERLRQTVVIKGIPPKETPPTFDVTLQFGHQADTVEDFTAATACDGERLRKFYEKEGVA